MPKPMKKNSKEPSEACGVKRNLKRSATAGSTTMQWIEKVLTPNVTEGIIEKRDYFYAITVKPNYEIDNEQGAIETMINMIEDKQFVFINDRRWEVDKNNKLHVHALIKVDYQLKYTDFMDKGWHIYLRPLKTAADIKKWKAYCSKGPEFEEVIMTHQSSKEGYMFINESDQTADDLEFGLNKLTPN